MVQCSTHCVRTPSDKPHLPAHPRTPARAHPRTIPLMSLIVQKYGGTSVGTLDRIRAVAQRVARTHAAGHGVVVVVSAMAGETNRLIDLAKSLSPSPPTRELDALVSTGEQVSAALTAMALQDLGRPARSFIAHQI